MSEDNVEDAYVITDAQPGASASEASASNIPAIRFGFVVLVDTEGTMYIERNKDAIAGVSVERDATLVEVRRYAQEVIFDLAAQAAAEYTTLRLSSQPKE